VTLSENIFFSLERNLINLIYTYRIKAVGVDSSTAIASKLPDLIATVVSHMDSLGTTEIEHGFKEMFAEVKALRERLTELDYRLIELCYGDRTGAWIQKLVAWAEDEGMITSAESQPHETALLYRHTHHAKVFLEQFLKSHDPALVPLILNEFRELPTYDRAKSVVEARQELDELVESIWLQALWEGGEL
jgi:hypothetical protein